MDIVGIVTGCVGAVTGCVGIIYARYAHSDAKEALKQAQAANKLASDANLISAQANGIAVEANQLSQDANAISERSHAIQTERNDVDWEYDWEGPGRVRVTNIGEDEALNVHVRACCDDEVETAEGETVGKDESLTLMFHGARKEQIEYEAEVAENEHHRDIPGKVPFAMVAALLNPPIQPIHIVSIRVTWDTPMGSQRCRNLKGG